ncbi:MAG TPA: toll/interleukin-1 receptor domain-containing protein, partial [Longimicrobiaceae bacterium]|nr:toll/interleukin-1 receptor domain-containing protein [Longimicrobiaceae bacterium]
MKKDFFVSYNKADRGWAEWIAWQLEEAGYSTVIQAWDFGAARNFVLAMQEAASNAERTIAVLSPDYLASRFTAPEWAAAFARDPTGKKGLLVPVRVRESDPKGLLPQIVYIDLVGITDANAAKEKLVREIVPGRRKPATEPPFPPGGESSEPPAFPGSSAPTRKRHRPLAPPREGYLFVSVPPMPDNFVGRDTLLTDMIVRLTSGEN